MSSPVLEDRSMRKLVFILIAFIAAANFIRALDLGEKPVPQSLEEQRAVSEEGAPFLILEEGLL
jgi:hypothetical protein